MTCTTLERLPDYNGGIESYRWTADSSEQTCGQSCQSDPKCDAYSFVNGFSFRCHLFTRDAVIQTRDIGSVLVLLTCSPGKLSFNPPWSFGHSECNSEFQGAAQS